MILNEIMILNFMRLLLDYSPKIYTTEYAPLRHLFAVYCNKITFTQSEIYAVQLQGN